MKTLTKHLIGFAIVTLILTVGFRYSLSFSLEENQRILSKLIPGLYFVGMFISGWIFGKKEYYYLPIYDIGFRFHVTTYLIFIVVSEIWFIFGFNSRLEGIRSVHYTAIIWGIFLFIHFLFYLYYRKKSIDGLDKNDLFE